MPKSGGQKLKLMYLNRYLCENTDENHPVTLSQIADYLMSMGISAERKSLYDDMEQLRVFGTDVLSAKSGKAVGYYVGERDFQVSELKLLVDAVQGSRFITQKKSFELIKKLEGLCSRFDAAELSRQVLVTNRIKSMNESIYYNVDKIHNAIGADRQITFRYFEYNLNKERVFRHDGALYHVSPFALNWDDENYYLIAFDSESNMLRHYRVDKMVELTVTDKHRDGEEMFGKLDMGLYTKKVFSMFGGDEKNVCMEFDEKMCGAVIDRFGKDVTMRKSDTPGRILVNSSIIVSPHFFGWIFSFGTMAKIVSPADVAGQFVDYARTIMGQYYFDSEKAR